MNDTEKAIAEFAKVTVADRRTAEACDRSADAIAELLAAERGKVARMMFAALKERVDAMVLDIKASVGK